MLMIRLTPKISDKPAPTKKRVEAAASPLSAWKRTPSRLMKDRHGRACHGHPRLQGFRQIVDGRNEPGHADVGSQFIAAAGRSFLTSSSLGCMEAPSTYLKFD